ncbi:chorismate mutase [uncultured Caballeronia sp.]|uniref:chorismate mutase n=1 Tax=uncultured Caballeronia sp. TaxID=1827198 RepID=UPI0035CBA338
MANFFVAGAFLSASSLAFATPVTDKAFYTLIELTVARLDVGRDVALTKWDTRRLVEDPDREKQVISTAASESSAAGVPEGFARNFFSDQIEANKLVQYGLMAQWHREGKAPASPRASLTDQIRPKLDKLQTAFIQQLASTKISRSKPECAVQIYAATSAYAVERQLPALYSIALDRALARVCGE